MRRSLRGRRTRRHRAIHPLGAVTLLLMCWGAFYRVLSVYTALAYPWQLDMGWLNSAGPGFPAIPVLGLVGVGALAMTGVVFLERENRHPAAFALAAVNLGFVAMLAAILHVHASFARDLARFRWSGGPSWSNLVEGIHGRWEVTARETPAGSPGFPARALVFDRWGFMDADPTRSSERVRARWQIEARADATIDPELPFERLVLGTRSIDMTIETRMIAGGPERPYLLLTTEHTASRDGVALTAHDWIAALRSVHPEDLELVSLTDRAAGRRPARAWLRRVERARAGYDLGEELARGQIGR